MSDIKVLFVDDEENVLKSLVRIFKENDYEIFTAKNPVEGLKIVRNNGIHLVVSDFRMPEMNGIEFLSEVDKFSSDTVKMILTGYADIDIVLAAINEGHVYKFLLKPWEEKVLKMEIRKSLD